MSELHERERLHALETLGDTGERTDRSFNVEYSSSIPAISTSRPSFSSFHPSISDTGQRPRLGWATAQRRECDTVKVSGRTKPTRIQEKNCHRLHLQGRLQARRTHRCQAGRGWHTGTGHA